MEMRKEEGRSVGSVERIRSSRGSLSRSVLLSLLLWQLAGEGAYLRGWSGDGRRRACRAVVRVYQGPSSKTYLRSQKVKTYLRNLIDRFTD